MIEPLRYYKEKSPTFIIKKPIFCNLCASKHFKQLYSNIACKFCTNCEKHYFLCLKCDKEIHRYGTNSRHIRRLIVIGPGIRKKVIVRGDAINYPLIFDNITIRYNANIYNNNKIIHQEPFVTTSFMSGISGRCVHVQIIGARNLLSADINGTSDPFIITMFNGKKLSATRMRPRTLNPNWSNETVIIPIDEMTELPRNMPKTQKDLVRFEVYDYDFFTKNDLLGNVEISKSHLINLAIQSNQQSICLPLTNRQFHGIIGIKLGYNNESLCLKVCRAEGLTNASPNFGLTNSFIKVYFNNKYIGKTSTVRHSLDPEWLSNNDFKFDLLDVLNKEIELIDKKKTIDVSNVIKNYNPLIDKRNRRNDINSNNSRSREKTLNVNTLQQMMQTPMFHKDSNNRKDSFNDNYSGSYNDNDNNSYSINQLHDLSLFTLEIYHQSNFSFKTKYMGTTYITIDYLRTLLPTLPTMIQYSKRKSTINQSRNKPTGLFSMFSPFNKSNRSNLATNQSNLTFEEDVNVGHLTPILDNEDEAEDRIENNIENMITNNVDDDPIYNQLNANLLANANSRPSTTGFNNLPNRPSSHQLSSRFSLRKLNNSRNSSRNILSLLDNKDIDSDDEDSKIDSEEDRLIHDELNEDEDENFIDNRIDTSYDYYIDDVDDDVVVTNDKSNHIDSQINTIDGKLLNHNMKSLSPFKRELSIMLPDNEILIEDETSKQIENQNQNLDSRYKNTINTFNYLFNCITNNKNNDEKDNKMNENSKGVDNSFFSSSKNTLRESIKSGKYFVQSKFIKSDDFNWSSIRHFKIEKVLGDTIVNSNSEDRGFVIVRLIMSNRGHTIVGLDEAIRRMSLGETASVLVRYDYAYGNFTVGAHIPPRANIIFNVQLLAINNKGRWQMPLRVLLRGHRFFRRWRKKIMNAVISKITSQPFYRRMLKFFGKIGIVEPFKSKIIESSNEVESEDASSSEYTESSSEVSDTLYSNSYVHVPVDPRMKSNLNRSVIAGNKLMWGFDSKRKVVHRKTAAQKKEEKRAKRRLEKKKQLTTISEEPSLADSSITWDNKYKFMPNLIDNDSDSDSDNENENDAVDNDFNNNQIDNEIGNSTIKEMDSRRDSKDSSDSKVDSIINSSGSNKRNSISGMLSSLSRRVSKSLESLSYRNANDVTNNESNEQTNHDTIKPSVKNPRKTSFDNTRSIRRVSNESTGYDALDIKNNLRRQSESIESVSSIGSKSVTQQAIQANRGRKIKEDEFIHNIPKRYNRSKNRSKKNKDKDKDNNAEDDVDISDQELQLVDRIMKPDYKLSTKFKIIKKPK